MKKHWKTLIKYLIICLVVYVGIINITNLYNKYYQKDFIIIPRYQWDATNIEYDMCYKYQENLSKCLTTIVIHHSAFIDQPGPNYILTYHIKYLGYVDIAYHFIIGKDGRIYEGRPVSTMGAHAGQTKEANELANKIRAKSLPAAPMVAAYKLDPDYGAIGICLDGNYEIEEPSEEQLSALRSLLKSLCFNYKIKRTNIILHNEVKDKITRTRGLTFIGPGTVCPGKYANKTIKQIVRTL